VGVGGLLENGPGAPNGTWQDTQPGICMSDSWSTQGFVCNGAQIVCRAPQTKSRKRGGGRGRRLGADSHSVAQASVPDAVHSCAAFEDDAQSVGDQVLQT